MGRAPCCEKMGLKRGPWTSEEDRILINHINTFGHSNWRALPKQAGLLRCGKSCRLRWINYLKPDIKRGNITKEEEDAIINLHEKLGNRWSAIAARLPGRTDNEIKNVWHTHLKKRLPQDQQAYNSNPKRNKTQTKLDTVDASKSNQDVVKHEQNDDDRPQSPPQCSSDISSLSTNTKQDMSNNNNNDNENDDDTDLSENKLALDEDFWSEVLSSDNSNETSGFLDIGTIDNQFEVPFSPPGTEGGAFSVCSSSMCNDMDFWHDVYARAEEITELLEL